MSLLKSYKKTNGKTEVITADNGSLKMIEMDMVVLQDGQSYTYSEKDKEFALIILGGKCSVNGEDFNFDNIGRRKNVFEGAATAVYIPRNKEFTIVAKGDVEIAVCKSPALGDFKPKLISPEDVVIKQLGKNQWQREAHFIVDERTEANLLYIGEAFVEGGMWASYPPHKHDEDNMPQEGILEEVYYFEFDKPQGFGIQKVYSKEGDIDETYTIKTGDFVEIPKGYHPYCAAPGYKGYYLWVMAGENRGFFLRPDKDHEWLNK